MKTLTLRLESYADDARGYVIAAQQLADERGHAEVEPVHLWYVLVDSDEVLQQGLTRAGVEPTDVLIEAEVILRKAPKLNGDAEAYLSPRFLDLLSRSEGEAARDNESVSTSHLAIACAQERTGGVRSVLRSSGVSAPVLRAVLQQSDNGGKAMKSSEDSSPLDAYGEDLTRLAADGHFDPVVGRDAELRRVVQVLARRRENNPLLVGEPGIGRTAIVQALALRIVSEDVPDMLVDKRIVSIDAGALVAGAKLRGQLEERMRGLLDAVRDSGGRVILFLPQLGAILNAKGGVGDMLSTALARGEVHAIGICTPDEERNALDDGSALSRRFVRIQMEAPTVDEAVAVLRGVVHRFEAAHGINITDPALVAAAQFARRYVTGVQLPKSAVDLIDESAARVRVEMESVPGELDSLRRQLQAAQIQLAALADDHDTESQTARSKLQAKADALTPRIADMTEAWEQSKLAAESVRKARAKGQTKQGGGEHIAEHDLHQVTPEDVAEVVALWTGVPVSKMLEEETSKLLSMESRLEERVVGQEHAVTALSKAVRRGRVGLRDPKRPIGSFLFLGPTGVGKTELAKALAEFLFDDEAALTRLDMSEFMEKHMVARLLGSPPGYVDSDAGGFLTETVRQRPYSVVLFDEMEKAHPDVFNILLQVLDDGRLSDSRGRMAYFRDTVVIMTSNVGSELILDHDGTNEELRERIREQLNSHFRPEFLNRIDDILIFDPLSKTDLRAIVEIQLRGLQKLLTHRRIKIDVSDAAKDRIVELGYEPAFGARPLKRVILKHLQDPLAEALLRGGFEPGNTVAVDVNADGDFSFTKRV